MKKTFREIPKEALPIQVPPALADAIRRIAADTRRSVSYAAVEAIARGLGHDPSRYGIETTEVAQSA